MEGVVASHHEVHLRVGEVASMLNNQERRTAHGLSFTKDLIYNLRRYHDTPAYVPANEQDARGPLSVADAARELAVNGATLYRWTCTHRIAASEK